MEGCNCEIWWRLTQNTKDGRKYKSVVHDILMCHNPHDKLLIDIKNSIKN